MQFTPQQLAGAGRYSQKTKIGNWGEDQSLSDAKLQNYLQKKAAGKLLTMEAKIRSDKLIQNVQLSYSSDGNLRYGDSIQIRSKSIAGGSALCSNIYDPVVLDGEVYNVSVAPPNTTSASTSTARSTFVIEKWAGHDQRKYDDVLRYGDPVLLACHPSLRVDDKSGLLKPLLHLRSSRVSTVDYAKMSNHQLVAMVGGKIDYNMVWEITRVANRKYQSKGAPVRVGDPIVFLHRATGTPLACDRQYTSVGEFGTEYEVSCHKYLSYGKTLNMILEKEGRCTGDVGQRAELSQNVWTIDTAGEPNTNSPINYSPMTPAVLINTMCTYLKNQGENTIQTLIDALSTIDKRGYGVLDQQEFIWCLRDFGIVLNDIESQIILNYFDKNNDGAITISEFTNAINSSNDTASSTSQQKKVGFTDGDENSNESKK